MEIIISYLIQACPQHLLNHVQTFILSTILYISNPQQNFKNDITPSQGSCDGGGPKWAGAQWIFPRCPQRACICPGATHFVTPFKRLTLKLFEEAQLSLCLSTKRFFETCFAASSSGWWLRNLKSISHRLTILKWWNGKKQRKKCGSSFHRQRTSDDDKITVGWLCHRCGGDMIERVGSVSLTATPGCDSPTSFTSYTSPTI